MTLAELFLAYRIEERLGQGFEMAIAPVVGNGPDGDRLGTGGVNREAEMTEAF